MCQQVYGRIKGICEGSFMVFFRVLKAKGDGNEQEMVWFDGVVAGDSTWL